LKLPVVDPALCASITFCICAASSRALAVAAGTVSVSSLSAASKKSGLVLSRK